MNQSLTKNISCIIIATKKYKSFVNPLLKSLDEHFLKNISVEYNVFYDDKDFDINAKRLIHKYIIPAYNYPYATLYRYNIIHQYRDVLAKYDHLLYIDVSMLAVSDIDESIINSNGLVAVEHPGYYKNKLGKYETNENSLAYFDIQSRKYPYVQGSIQGGKSDLYLKAADTMKDRVDTDEKRGIVALWHDESHWNRYINETTENIKLLSPSYSYCGDYYLPNISPIIVKLHKAHKSIRSKSPQLKIQLIKNK